MRAITDTPANTPNPIGRTCICLPGIANAAVVPVAPGEEAVEEARAAAAAETELASMLDGPNTDTSVGAASAPEEMLEALPEIVEDAWVPSVAKELGPMTDTSVGSTNPVVTTPLDAV